MTGASAVPLTTGEIRAYFDAFELADSISFEDFYEAIRTIDNIWLDVVHKHESKKIQEGKKPPAANARPPKYVRKGQVAKKR